MVCRGGARRDHVVGSSPMHQPTPRPLWRAGGCRGPVSRPLQPQPSSSPPLSHRTMPQWRSPSPSSPSLPVLPTSAAQSAESGASAPLQTHAPCAVSTRPACLPLGPACPANACSVPVFPSCLWGSNRLFRPAFPCARTLLSLFASLRHPPSCHCMTSHRGAASVPALPCPCLAKHSHHFAMTCAAIL